MFYCCLIQHNVLEHMFYVVLYNITCLFRVSALSTFRMRDQSFLFSKDIYGGQSKSVLCRFQQACFLPEKLFCAEGSCRHSFAARPFRLHPPAVPSGRSKYFDIRFPRFYIFHNFLPFACQIRVPGAQKISMVARVKACHVAWSKHVFLA